MTMSYDPLAYEMPWRPNYEKNAVAGWLAASGAALAVEQVSTMPSGALLLDDGDLWRDGDGSFAKGYQTSPAPKAFEGA